MLTSTAALGVLVVVAAAAGGTLHFSGARWVPSLHLSSGASRQQPLRPPSGSAPAPGPKLASGSGHFPLWIVWVLLAARIVGAGLLLWRWWLGRRSAEAGAPAGPAIAAVGAAPAQPDVPDLRTGIERALATLDETREPADAVVRAWLGLQETAESSGIIRRPSETPTELTARILGGALTDDRAVRTLLRLYLRTRFGNHPVTTEDVAAVRAALSELVTTWPAPATAADAR